MIPSFSRGRVRCVISIFVNPGFAFSGLEKIKLETQKRRPHCVYIIGIPPQVPISYILRLGPLNVPCD
jgi:hypothetical protein